jgi:hypothetical protein
MLRKLGFEEGIKMIDPNMELESCTWITFVQVRIR